mmetsp:Transcript_12340/g.24710  ORF Transcript_12340/g.24710 Transcript_12340/m.24710 type:complete len:212 (-) Transcript_12340:2373-3008(-)
MNAVATGGDQHQHQQDDQNSMEQNNNNIISSSSESLPSLSPTLSYSSSSSLVKENERLRKELLLLRHEMRQMEETQNQKQHNHQNHSRPFLPTTPEDKSIDNSPTIRRIILELPVTLRNYAMMSCNNNNNKSNIIEDDGDNKRLLLRRCWSFALFFLFRQKTVTPFRSHPNRWRCEQQQQQEQHREGTGGLATTMPMLATIFRSETKTIRR